MKGARFLKATASCFSILLGCYSMLFAEDNANEIDLERIVVTPYRYEESVTKTASNVTVVNRDDIKNSNIQNVVDVFRSIPGMAVRDYYGNGNQASVDISGFGEQAALNVLVLVDGRRVNDIDLSGVDWNQISQNRIQRIEVIRGGSGGVLYGDNASSGVINIITRKGSGKPNFDLGTEYGSYDLNKQRLSLNGALDNKFSFWLSSERGSLNGYRNNSFNKTNDFSSKFEYALSDALSARFSSGFNASTYGLSGALFQANIDQNGRIYSSFSNDHANKKDYYFLTGAKIDLSELGAFDFDFGFRHKNNNSLLLTSYISFPTFGGVQKDLIKTLSVTPKYILGNSILNHDNKFIVGLDYFHPDYKSVSYALSDNNQVNYTNIRKSSLSGYIQDELSIFKQLVLVGGYRYESVRYAFNFHDNSGFSPDQDTKLYFNQWAFNAELAYAYGVDSSIYLNMGRSYRFPEIDEFNFFDSNGARQLNTNLKPQSAITYQTGLRHKFSNRLKGTLSFSRMNVKNYLYFNATQAFGPFGWNSQNENYDKSIHDTADLALDVELNNHLVIFGNYTFTNAYFDGGVYNNNKIPLVPQHKGSVGLRFILPNNVSLNVLGTYLGKKYGLNDQANAFSQLNGYTVVDTNLSWNYKNLEVTFGINNLFDKQYSEYAGVQVNNGARFYYPSPGRNFILKGDYKF